jgi:hypothetical protein
LGTGFVSEMLDGLPSKKTTHSLSMSFLKFIKKQPDSVLLLMGDRPLFEEVRKKVTLLG